MLPLCPGVWLALLTRGAWVQRRAGELGSVVLTANVSGPIQRVLAGVDSGGGAEDTSANKVGLHRLGFPFCFLAAIAGSCSSRGP